MRKLIFCALAAVAGAAATGADAKLMTLTMSGIYYRSGDQGILQDLLGDEGGWQMVASYDTQTRSLVGDGSFLFAGQTLTVHPNIAVDPDFGAAISFNIPGPDFTAQEQQHCNAGPVHCSNYYQDFGTEPGQFGDLLEFDLNDADPFINGTPFDSVSDLGSDYSFQGVFENYVYTFHYPGDDGEEHTEDDVYFEPSDLSLHDIESAVPEPGSWAMMIAGFGAVGGAIRRRKVNVSYA